MPTELAPEQIEELAEGEHERWRAFMAAHGFRYGANHDDVARTRPGLVPWADASERDREYTRSHVSQYPRLVAQLGYRIQPREPS